MGRDVSGRHGEKEVPEHPCLELVSNSEEKLQTHVSRRLVTMKKTAEYEEKKEGEYKEFCRKSIKRNNISYANLKEFVYSKKKEEWYVCLNE